MPRIDTLDAFLAGGIFGFAFGVIVTIFFVH